MISNEQLSRRLGLAVSEPVANQLSISEFIDDHLSRPPSKLVVKTHTDPFNAAEPLPKDLVYSLWKRVGFTKKWWRQLEKAEKFGDEAKIDAHMRPLEYLFKDRFDEKIFTNYAIFSHDDINHRISHFWLNHFTVGLTGSNRNFIGDYWETVVYGGIYHKFKDLLYSCVTHPAMLDYLDNIENVGERSQSAKWCKESGDCEVGLNDNLAREILELHTVTPERGYSEYDIKNGAKVLAGWGSHFQSDFSERVNDYYQPWEPAHAEPGNKEVLGLRLGAGKKSLRKLTDFLAEDDATVHHLSSKLLAHFATHVSREDVEVVSMVWRQTDGSLPAIHRKVLEIAAATSAPNAPWPLTWGMQVCRMSQANPFLGYEEDVYEFGTDERRDPHRIWPEIGMSFWSVRQPDGFSQNATDWSSTEYMDRRVRFADMVFSYGRPELTVDEIMDVQRVRPETRALVAKATKDKDKFILLMCSPEMMEA